MFGIRGQKSTGSQSGSATLPFCFSNFFLHYLIRFTSNGNGTSGTHSSTKQKFHCDLCNETFAWKSTLVRHKRTAHASCAELACPLCDKQYTVHSVLQDHVRRDHLIERKHGCSRCEKRFYKLSDLKVHERVHLKIKPYVCAVCGHTFSHISHLHRY